MVVQGEMHALNSCREKLRLAMDTLGMRRSCCCMRRMAAR